MDRATQRVLNFVIGLALLGVPTVSSGQLILYDDFSEGRIDPTRWFGAEIQQGDSSPSTETSRRIRAGQLELGLTSYGDTSSDEGRARSPSQRLRLTNGSDITTMQADVTILRAKMQGCSLNDDSTRTRAGIRGEFFNDGSSTGPEDRTGDVRVDFEKRRDSAGENVIRARVFRCINPACDVNDTIDSHVFNTVPILGVADTLGLDWDSANNQFLFSVNPGTAGVENVALSYEGILDDDPPSRNGKELRVANQIVNCTVAQRGASIRARFDNVMINMVNP